MTQKNKEWIFIFFSILFVGCYATIAQVLLIREFLVVYFGSELCLGIILGTWLFGVASGAAIGGWLVNKFKDQLSAFIYILLSMCAILPLDIFLVRISRYLLNVPTGEYIPILSIIPLTIFIVVPFSFTIGLIFPIACKVNYGTTRTPSSDIGITYIIESVGSLIGGLVFTFFLVSRFQPLFIILVFDCLLFLNIFLMQWTKNKEILRTSPIGPGNLQGKQSRSKQRLLNNLFRKGWTRSLRGKALVCLILLFVSYVLLISGMADKVDDYFIKFRWQLANPNIELVESVDSRYENIVIGSRDGQYSVYGNGQYNFAFPNDYEYSQLAHLVMTQHPGPKKVLLIGGGMGGLIKEMLKHSVDELHYVALDPSLVELTKKYLPQDEINALSDRRVKIFYVDGRHFVKNKKGDTNYDLVFVNIPDPSTAFLNRFYTLEFFREISILLEKRGVFAIGISSAINYLGETAGNYTGSIYKTLHKVFPYVIVTPGRTNYYFASNSPDPATFDIKTLEKRYVDRNIRSDYFSEHLFSTLLPPERVAFIENELKNRNGLEINTDSKPVTYFYNLMLWDKLSGGQLADILEWLGKTHLTVILIPILLFILFRIVYVRLTRRSVEAQQRFNSIAAIGTTGFAGMALEIILIFAFQNIYGYIYEKIGMLIALFMFGLAMGCIVGNRMISHNTSGNATGLLGPIKKLIYLEVGIIVYAASVPFVLDRLSFQFPGPEYHFMLLVIITGVLTGMEFPISSKLYYTSKGDLGTTAGVINSADHAGAFIGAILTGVIFIPIFGVIGSCVIIISLKIASLIFLIYLHKSSSASKTVSK